MWRIATGLLFARAIPPGVRGHGIGNTDITGKGTAGLGMDIRLGGLPAETANGVVF